MLAHSHTVQFCKALNVNRDPPATGISIVNILGAKREESRDHFCVIVYSYHKLKLLSRSLSLSSRRWTGGERNRQRDRQTETETEGDRERQRETERDREVERETETQRHTERHRVSL